MTFFHIWTIYVDIWTIGCTPTLSQSAKWVLSMDRSNSRVVDIINFLATYPADSFSMSQISAHLGLSHGSAHRVLGTLTEAGYVSRHPRHKTYSLGLAMVMIGQA
ncbi:MAG: helix-turn-helix domain-containing protein, partial [Pigmentiphaga sp.]